MKRVTIKDIAKMLQITPSTVSRALKDHPDVSESTRQKVKQVAQAFNYRPNATAINFRKQHSGLVALILPDLNTFFFPSVIKSIQAATKSVAYHLIILQSDNTLAGEKQCLDFCQQIAVDGIIACIGQETSNLNHFSSLFQQEIPIVFIDEFIKSEQSITISIDDEKAGEEVTNFLINKGHTAIGAVLGNPNVNITQERLEGFSQALRKKQLPVAEPYIVYADTPDTAGQAFLQMWETTSPPPSALFIMTDELLVGVMPVIQRLGIKVPEDLAIICISDGEAPNYFHPAITHLLHDGTKVGQLAIETLFELMKDGKKQRARTLFVSTQLVDLGSV